MPGVWALVAFVGVIVVWNAVFKRNIGEAMILGFLAVCAFAFVGGVEGGGSPLSAIGAAVLIFASAEGASPPSGAPIYVASGIAQVDPAKTFMPLLSYYCLPILGMGVLIAVGALPV